MPTLDLVAYVLSATLRQHKQSSTYVLFLDVRLVHIVPKYMNRVMWGFARSAVSFQQVWMGNLVQRCAPWAAIVGKDVYLFVACSLVGYGVEQPNLGLRVASVAGRILGRRWVTWGTASHFG